MPRGSGQGKDTVLTDVLCVVAPASVLSSDLVVFSVV